jgi:predicted nucleotidyltransferase
MTVTGQLRRMLIAVAEGLGQDLRERLVFVGGCTTALFVSDPVVLEEVRFTDAVDLIVDLVGLAAWGKLQETLRERGFKVSPEDEVICRMRLGTLKVDFMPDDEKILGFSNRWYRRGIEAAEISVLADGLSIRRLAPPFFLATKLEAWLGRGGGDLLTSRDLEDVLLVVDGRRELVDEVKAAQDDVRGYIAEQIATLLKTPGFEDFLAGNIRGPEGRVGIVADRLAALSRAAG